MFGCQLHLPIAAYTSCRHLVSSVVFLPLTSYITPSRMFMPIPKSFFYYH